MNWMELWFKLQVLGMAIGIVSVLILVGMAAYAYIADWLEEKKGK